MFRCILLSTKIYDVGPFYYSYSIKRPVNVVFAITFAQKIARMIVVVGEFFVFETDPVVHMIPRVSPGTTAVLLIAALLAACVVRTVLNACAYLFTQGAESTRREI